MQTRPNDAAPHLDEATFKQECAKALALPPYPYLTLSSADIQEGEIIHVRQGHSAISRATSKYPVIGTDSLDPCTQLMVYDAGRKVGGCSHKVPLTAEDFTDLLHAVRGDSARPVKVYVLGFNNDVAIKAGMEEIDECRAARHHMAKLLRTIETTPGCALVCCDIDEKPHPYGAYLDTRNGRLIRASGDVVVTCDELGNVDMHTQPLKDVPRIVQETPLGAPEGSHFDYTALEHQLKTYKQRKPANLGHRNTGPWPINHHPPAHPTAPLS